MACTLGTSPVYPKVADAWRPLRLSRQETSFGQNRYRGRELTHLLLLLLGLVLVLVEEHEHEYEYEKEYEQEDEKEDEQEAATLFGTHGRRRAAKRVRRCGRTNRRSLVM